VWNTRQGVANAMVVGLLPRLRFVVLTDRLLLDLTSDEVEAVFGHEVGHVKHHHMPLYFSFLSISLMVLLGVWELVVPYLASGSGALAGFERAGLSPSDWTWPMVIGSLVVHIFVVFGFLSRRCERQADIYGCRAVSCDNPDCQGHEDEAVRQARGRSLCPTGIKTFVSALEKVAELNGISRSRPGWLQSWQHSTIACRVEFLQRMLIDPAIEPRFQRRVFLVKWGLMVGLCALLVLLSYTLGQRGDSPQATPARVAQLDR
jgi:STE24 endopeptidase